MQESIADFFHSLGISLSNDALLVILCLLSAGLGYVLARVIVAQRLKTLHQAQLAQQEKDQAQFDDQLDQLGHTFSTLSQQALRNNNESFLTLAQQSFSQLQSNASHDLKTREQKIANLLKPIEQSLQATDQQLRKLDSDRKVTETRLGEQVNNLLLSQHQLQAETRNLVSALRRPEVRGQWGELTLKRLVELAGMSEYCDFSEQITVSTDEGALRPDMIIRLPSERQLVVDVKTPLDAYLSAVESDDPQQQDAFLQQHQRNVKQRIKELAQKQYWQQFPKSPDFVILFIPGDQFLSAALEQDKDMLEYALGQKILLATPTSLVGLLRAVAYGWSQDALSQNSEEIRRVGKTLYQRLQTLTEHLNKLGRHLDQSMEQFNKLVGSYQSNTLPAAEKLSKLGIDGESAAEISPSSTAKARQLAPRDSEE